jgi:hypothetical protein
MISNFEVWNAPPNLEVLDAHFPSLLQALVSLKEQFFEPIFTALFDDNSYSSPS